MDGLAIGLDIGTSSLKGSLVNAEGCVLASRQEQQQMLPGPHGWQEQDPVGSWWPKIRSIVSALSATEAARSQRISCIGITGFVPGMCLLDADGNLLRNAIVHTDTRAEDELCMIREQFPEVHQGLLLPKLLWVARHEQSVFQQVSTVVVPHAWVAGRLTGRYVCDYDTATIYGAVFDGHSLCWKEDVCGYFGIPARILPPVVGASRIIGELLPAVAKELGLPSGIPVVAGTGDSFATLLGTGAHKSGTLMLYWGTSGTRVFVHDDPAVYVDGPYFQAGRAEFTGRFFSCGESMNHMAALLGRSLPDLDALAAEILPLSQGVMFFPHGKQQRSKAGLDASDHVVGLQLEHGPGHVHRAVLEAIAYNSMSIPEVLGQAREVRICGGAAQSGVLRSIVASLSPVPVLDARKTSASRGAAMLAYLGCAPPERRKFMLQYWTSMLDCPVVVPDAQMSAIYMPAMAEYESMRSKLYNL